MEDQKRKDANDVHVNAPDPNDIAKLALLIDHEGSVLMIDGKRISNLDSYTITSRIPEGCSYEETTVTITFNLLTGSAVAFESGSAKDLFKKFANDLEDAQSRQKPER